MHPITGGSVILRVTPVGTSSSFIQSGSIYTVVAALVLAAFIATVTPAGAIAAVAKEVLKDIVETVLKPGLPPPWCSVELSNGSFPSSHPQTKSLPWS